MKPFDVVIFGATSFVGKLVVQHFLEVHGVGRSVSWAMAGRSLSKLQALKTSYGPAAVAPEYRGLGGLCRGTRIGNESSWIG